MSISPQFHYDWHWIWNTGNGDLGNLRTHTSDTHTTHHLKSHDVDLAKTKLTVGPLLQIVERGINDGLIRTGNIKILEHRLTGTPRALKRHAQTNPNRTKLVLFA